MSATNSCLELEGTSSQEIPSCYSICYQAPHRVLGEKKDGHIYNLASWSSLYIAVTWSDANHYRFDCAECPASFIVVLVNTFDDIF